MWRHERGFGGERHADRAKESVRIQWIKTTCVCLRWGHRNAAHTCEEQWRHLHPPGAPHACFQNFFLLPTFCCSQRKLLACRLHCGLHLVRLAKQINKYSLLLHGHLPPWPVSRTILWKALPWQEAPWRNLCGQRSHGKKAAGKADAQDAPEGLVLRSTVCLPRSECFLLQIIYLFLWIWSLCSSCLYSLLKIHLSKLVLWRTDSGS